MTDPARLRETYSRGHLDEADLAATWLAQLRIWFETAVADPAIPEANAMQFATVSPDGRPAVRTLLAKAIDERGVVFYTNYDSPKARDLAANPRCSAVFAWLAHQRQVRIAGTVTKIARAETEAYFTTRPRDSQIGAWASPQSQVVESRAALDELAVQAAARFADAEIPAPPNWGGYLITPDEVEFWQGREGRLHDRIRFRLAGEEWVVERLAP